jgi:nicotinate-nucleotide adenylyltransferase
VAAKAKASAKPARRRPAAAKASAPAARAWHVSEPLGFGSIAVHPPLAMPGQRIGLLGGSFDPAHEAHLQISQYALKRLRLEGVWWLVSPGNPLKGRPDMAPLEQRLASARTLARDERITVTGFEAALHSAYSAGTVEFLARRFPAVRFVWLMGADCLFELHRWRQWRSIMETMPVAVIDRPGWRLKAMAAPAAGAYRRSFVAEDCAALLAKLEPPAWTFLTVPLSPLSSTELRKSRRQVRPRNGAAKKAPAVSKRVTTPAKRR